MGVFKENKEHLDWKHIKHIYIYYVYRLKLYTEETQFLRESGFVYTYGNCIDTQLI